jgi:hypothetical protein
MPAFINGLMLKLSYGAYTHHSLKTIGFLPQNNLDQPKQTSFYGFIK